MEQYVEIYHTGSTPEALRVLDVILRPKGIAAVLHDRTSKALPAPASEPGVLSIAVPTEQRALAEKLLREAIQDGYLDPSQELHEARDLRP